MMRSRLFIDIGHIPLPRMIYARQINLSLICIIRTTRTIVLLAPWELHVRHSSRAHVFFSRLGSLCSTALAQHVLTADIGSTV